MLNENIKKDIVKCAQANELLFYQWDHHLHNGTINCKQLDSNLLGIQIFIPDKDGFPVYERIKEELKIILSMHDILFDNEINLRQTKAGWFKQLYFVKSQEIKHVNISSESFSVSSIPTVFVSYNWGNEVFVDEIEDALTGKADIRRDKTNLKAWGSITDFMKSIRQQDFAVLVISDAYLKSSACLYEVIQLMKDDNWANKTMNLVMDDARAVYDASKRADYIQFWDNKCKELEQKIKPLPTAATTDLIKELEKSNTILLSIGAFMAMVADANNPNVNEAISKIINRISMVDTQVARSNRPPLPSSNIIDASLSNNVWVGIDYYKNEYRMGSTPNIPDADFPFFEKQAVTKINWKHVVVNNPHSCLKDCVCEVAEMIHRKAPEKEIRSAIVKHLSETEYHNDFVHRGL